MTASQSQYASVASSSSASAFSLTNYYGSVVVSNLTLPGATGATIIWARADGTAAVAQADGCYAIDPGESVTLDNGESYWSQGLANVPAGTVTVSNGTPAIVQPFGSSLAGGIANPGTHVSVILDTGAGPVQVSVASDD